ncbi:MAG: hypothetical protein E7568_05230 [Ruminococcaceae bacterium]|nr:hypothetical protein [Oscillospiraceae bacterium]
MKSKIIKFIAAFLCAIVISGVVVPEPINVGALTPQEKYNAAQKALNDAKKKKDAQNQIKKALDDKINATQELIDDCNAKISNLNSKISAKQAQIDAKKAEMEADNEQFRKRIRSIYMTGTQSNIQILLGAEDFSDYLVLAEMTSNLAAKDNQLIERINDAIKIIEDEQADIKKLLDEQKKEKKELDGYQQDLKKDVAEVNSVIKGLNNDIAKAQKDMNEAAEKINQGSSNSNISFAGGNFLWPVAGHYYISAGWQSNDSVHNGNHKGIDIAGGGIAGKPVRAAADGKVYIVSNNCTHNYGKNYSCGCGGGYGNYVAIDHGPSAKDGKTYKTLYAHMKKAAVSNGAYVKRGQIIGYVGTTGWSTGNHLHFEVIVNGVKKNPANFAYDR